MASGKGRGPAGEADYTPPMLLDHALRMTFRNFSTLFLLAALVAAPLHLAHAVAFRSVIALRELHPDIEDFGEHKLVRGVGRSRLEETRRSDLLLSAVELALLPLLLGAARRTLEADARGEVPTALGALRRLPGSLRGWAAARRALPEVVAVAAIGLVVGWLVREIGLVLAEPVPMASAFLAVGLVESVAHATGGALVAGGVAGLRTASHHPLAEDA
jgi:hypothetical protein